MTISLSSYAGGGLNQAQVDARVVAVVPTMKPYLTPRLYLLSNVPDDSAVYIQLPANVFAGQLQISNNNNGFPGYGLLNFRCTSSTVFCVVTVGHANLAATTGILAGTTGTDGKVTVSTHTDGRIYVENRLGTALTFCLQVAGVALESDGTPVP